MEISTHRTSYHADMYSGLDLTGRLPPDPLLELTLHFAEVVRFYSGLAGGHDEERVFYDSSTLGQYALGTFLSDDFLSSIDMPLIGEQERPQLVEGLSWFIRSEAEHVHAGRLQVVAYLYRETSILGGEQASAPWEEMQWGDCDGNDAGSCCAVCLEGFLPRERVARLPCRHPFHGACIARWLGMRPSCPVCRFEM